MLEAKFCLLSRDALCDLHIMILQLGQYKDCLGELQAALNYSEDLKDHSHDADILGEIADAYADLGNFEQAAKVYTPNDVEGNFWDKMFPPRHP